MGRPRRKSTGVRIHMVLDEPNAVFLRESAKSGRRSFTAQMNLFLDELRARATKRP